LRRTAIVLAIPPLGMLLLLVWQVVLGHRWGKAPMSNGDVIGWTIFLCLIYLRLITVRLVTEVRGQELRVGLRGLWRSERIPLSRIQAVETIDYDPVRDFGTYGVRTTRSGTGYLAGGAGGVRIALSGGKKLVIGSRRPADLARALLAPNPAGA
jgi:hypothetical protein